MNTFCTISEQFFAEHQITPGSHPSYRHEDPTSQAPAFCSLQKPPQIPGQLNDDQAKDGGALLEQPDLLLTVAFFVVLHS
jgi:hypothetical protein